MKDTQFAIEGRTDTYVIEVHDDGRLTCTCLGFRYRDDCSHLGRVRQAAQLEVNRVRLDA